MGAAASAEMSADQLKEKYAEVKHRLYPNQQAEAEELMEKEASTAEIMEYVNKALNDPEVSASKLNFLHIRLQALNLIAAAAALQIAHKSQALVVRLLLLNTLCTLACQLAACAFSSGACC
jgi:heme O synthase-like polyprenyltransferase